MRYRGGRTPDFGAIWVTYFPTHMIELYPHVLVLSTLYPKGPQRDFEHRGVLLSGGNCAVRA